MAVDNAAAQTAVELKFGQVGVASAILHTLDAQTLQTELQRRIAAAPALFVRAPLVLDLSRLPQLPEIDQARAMLDAVRRAGMLPVGLSYGTAENERLASTLELPLFAKFRHAAEARDLRADTDAPGSADTPASAPGVHSPKPVRSGQQVYARGRDLVLTATVGNGAEVIADGSIHVYGRLSGRAIAGAQGDATARIYCRDFQAELISIAGHYRVLEDVRAELRGQSVQAWLDGERLMLEKL
jgi:septum site-determining protein MinC